MSGAGYIREVSSDFYTPDAVRAAVDALSGSTCEITTTPIPGNRISVAIKPLDPDTAKGRTAILEFWNKALALSCEEKLGRPGNTSWPA